MKIKNLTDTPLIAIVDCLLKSFEGYFVQLPSDLSYWEERFKTARVDLKYSYGMFDNQQLVGFIVNGIDIHSGKKTAYNSGTGVLPEYRGHAIVDSLYDHALPEFQKAGIEKCLLEVIRENHRALKVYKRIGFKIKRGLNSFKGKLTENTLDHHLKKVSYGDILKSGFYRPQFYSWDNLAKAVEISEANKDSYLVSANNDSVLGYFTMGPGGQIVQVEAAENTNISEIIKSMGKITPEIRFGNIPDERCDLIGELNILGLENTINQYEMEYHLG